MGRFVRGAAQKERKNAALFAERGNKRAKIGAPIGAKARELAVGRSDVRRTGRKTCTGVNAQEFAGWAARGMVVSCLDTGVFIFGDGGWKREFWALGRL
jgi:hypothetical protein